MPALQKSARFRLKPVMKKRASDASSEGLSPDEYRRVIVRAYRKE
jgi:hypothetical protein